MLSGFFVAIENRQSKFEASPARTSSGGIAQLVERQLCKLDVRGSNPLASKAPRARGKSLQRQGRTPRIGGSQSPCLQSPQGARQESTTAGPHSSDRREPIPLP